MYEYSFFCLYTVIFLNPLFNARGMTVPHVNDPILLGMPMQFFWHLELYNIYLQSVLSRHSKFGGSNIYYYRVLSTYNVFYYYDAYLKIGLTCFKCICGK